MKKLVQHLNGFSCWDLNGEQNIVYLIQIGRNKYIGSTGYAKARLVGHVNSIVEHRHQNEKVQKAYDEIKTFTIYLLEECNSKEEAFRKEKNYIREIQPNLNNVLYFKDYLLPLQDRKELIKTLYKVFTIARGKQFLKLRDIQKITGVKKGWLNNMGKGYISFNEEQFTTILNILKLSVICKNEHLYLRCIGKF